MLKVGAREWGELLRWETVEGTLGTSCGTLTLRMHVPSSTGTNQNEGFLLMVLPYACAMWVAGRRIWRNASDRWSITGNLGDWNMACGHFRSILVDFWCCLQRWHGASVEQILGSGAISTFCHHGAKILLNSSVLGSDAQGWKTN